MSLWHVASMVFRKNADLVIHLKEIPHEGQSFHLSRQSGELNKALNSLVGKGDYDIHFNITPMGEDAFELKGYFNVEMGLVCSRCAFDFKTKVHEEFHEILVVSEELPRKGHLGRPNHSTEGFLEQGPFFIELKSPYFSIADYAHEIIALAEPLNPLGKENCDDNCENYLKALHEVWLEKQESSKASDNPFSILEQLKIDSIKNT